MTLIFFHKCVRIIIYISKMQKLITIFVIFNFIAINYVITEQQEIDDNKKPLASFRLKMEELSENQTYTVNDDESTDKFVSFLMDSVKELFINAENVTMNKKNADKSFNSALLLNGIRKSTKPYSDKESQTNFNNSTTELLPTSILQADNGYSIFNNSNRTGIQLVNLKNDVDSMTNQQLQNYALQSIRFPVINVYKFAKENRNGISCIACDNVMNKNCNDPKFKLIPSIICEREDDLCYTQHTPFGIIDRGCFNINHNLSLFVCACNLCNYISIYEMPYIFSNKRDWIENVIELSRAKRFRESIFKDMSCLRCEVNVTAKTGDMVADADCLEGNIAMLPDQVCASDEICAVKAIRSEGYVWRGCVSEPLYNYWWTLCDSDLCNYDSIVSVYDAINI